MKDKQSMSSETGAREGASGSDESDHEMSAARIADKLGSLQEIATLRGFKFLGYMLDIARAEAESLHYKNQPTDNENSIGSD